MIFMFDMGGVVANSSSMKNIINELGINEHEYRLFQIDSAGRNTYKQLSVGSISTEDYWKNFSTNFKKEITQDYFKDFYNPVINYSVLLHIKNLKKNIGLFVRQIQFKVILKCTANLVTMMSLTSFIPRTPWEL